MNQSYPINNEPFKPPYKSKGVYQISKVESEILHSLDNIKGGNQNGGEIYVKGDYDNPKDGDVVVTERGVETRVGGELLSTSISNVGKWSPGGFIQEINNAAYVNATYQTIIHWRLTVLLCSVSRTLI